MTVKSNTHDQWDYTVNSPTLPSLSNFNQSNTISSYVNDSFINDHLSYKNENKFNRSYFPYAPSKLNYSSKSAYCKSFGLSALPPSSMDLYESINSMNIRKRKMKDITNTQSSSRFHLHQFN